jgi:hypothetical protein
MEAVDEGLKVLSESGRQMVFFHLERSYSIKKHDIPRKPEAFAAGLEKIFGVGASVLEKLIVKSLYSKLGLKYEDKEEYTFADYLKDAKKVKQAGEANNCSSSSSASTEIREVIATSKSLAHIDFVTQRRNPSKEDDKKSKANRFYEYVPRASLNQKELW